MKNLTLKNITDACRGTYHGDPHLLDQEADGVVIDSRKVRPGYLFVAIDGVKVNAHKFIPDTVKAGALCVVSHEDLGETDYPYILVESTGQALLDIAKLYRDSFDLKVVGITGSAGKTSTKEMIASVIAQKYNVHKTLGNFNNEWGLPITIFEMNETTKVQSLKWASIISARCGVFPPSPARISVSLPISASLIWNSSRHGTESTVKKCR